MDRQKITMIARVLGLVGVLFILAMAFDMMPRKYALFAGVACFVVAGSMWGIGGRRN
jgi:uncharacterized membrane protein YqjE